MSERQTDKRERALEILRRLAREYPEARIALRFQTPLELLVAVILSAQCTDTRVNEVTPVLFSRYRSARELAGADRAELEALIRPCGLFRAKARSLIEASRRIEEAHGGRVPSTRSELVGLPGVGNKTAGVVSMHLSGEPAFPVDTHVARLAWRLGLSPRGTPDQIEARLRQLLPQDWWMPGHHLLIWHGRRVCAALRPWCSSCVVADLCPRRGVSASR